MSNEIYVNSYWPTHLIFSDHENPEKINNHLIKHIYKWKEKDEYGVNRSNVGGWHSDIHMFKKNQFKEITDWINLQVQKSNEILRLKNGSSLIMDTMWANVNGKFHYNERHNHPRAHLSGVYYVKVPDENSQIIFYDPRTANTMIPMDHEITENDIDLWGRVYVTPKEGQLILFPSYLDHSVEMNCAEEDRISISFNFFQHT